MVAEGPADHAIPVSPPLYSQVVPEGPADHAIPRMEKGDILKEIDSVSVESLAHAKSLILGKPGSQVTRERDRSLGQ